MAGSESYFDLAAGELWKTIACVGLASVVLYAVYVSRILPVMDAREPPLLMPTIPAYGHSNGLSRNQTRFLPKLYNKAKLPIATLPMLRDKVYAVWEPSLVQAVFRNTQLSLLPLAIHFAHKQLNLTDNAANLVMTTNVMPDFTNVLHTSLTGKYVPRMNRTALRYIAGQLEEKIPGGEWVEMPNFYGWLRDMISMATSEGLYGPGNILKHDPKLIEDLWEFETGQSQLVGNRYPSITASKPWKARANVQAALERYYTTRQDEHEDASELVKARVRVLRSYGMSDKELGQFELSLLQVSTANTAPAVFWLASFIISRSELVAQLREELQSVVDRDGDVATVDARLFEEKCPLLIRCHKETMRLAIHATNLRHVTADTTIADSQGNSYLLKAGSMTALSAIQSHTFEGIWGEDANSFEPDRFLSANDKTKRASYHPFGGGRHLCPGRNFAVAQMLGFVAALVMGHDVWPLEGKDAPWKLPAMSHAALSEAAVKPANHGEGFGVRIRRREGWEKIKWVYEC